MNERIKFIRAKLGKNQTSFGEMFGVSKSAVQKWESGENTPADSVLKLMAQTTGINYVWLRTGDGEPSRQETREEEILRFATQTVTGSDEFKKAFVATLSKLDSEDWGRLAEIFKIFLGEINNGK